MRVISFAVQETAVHDPTQESSTTPAASPRPRPPSTRKKNHDIPAITLQRAPFQLGTRRCGAETWIRGVRVVFVPLRNAQWGLLEAAQFEQRRRAVSTALFEGARGGEVLSFVALAPTREMFAKIAVHPDDGENPVTAAVALCQSALHQAGLSTITATEAGAEFRYACSVEAWRFEDREAAA